MHISLLHTSFPQYPVARQQARPDMSTISSYRQKLGRSHEDTHLHRHIIKARKKRCYTLLCSVIMRLALGPSKPSALIYINSAIATILKAVALYAEAIVTVITQCLFVLQCIFLPMCYCLWLFRVWRFRATAAQYEASLYKN